MRRPSAAITVALVGLLTALAACTSTAAPTAPGTAGSSESRHATLPSGQSGPAAVPASSAATDAGPTAAAATAAALVPAPVSVSASGAAPFLLADRTRVVADDEAAPIAALLADYLRPTGISVREPDGQLPAAGAQPGDIVIRIADVPALDGDETGEGYQLTITAANITIDAPTSHGLFNGVQTLRQLLPAAAGEPSATTAIPAATIVDYPRFGYRGVMVDIARHFRTPAEMETLIDAAAGYKINTLHLHLSDDQGFRVAIDAFPRLTAIGAQGAVGTDGRAMDPGGFWTRDDYQAVVAYAAARYMTVIPEVDSPGHTNAIILSEVSDTDNPLLAGDPADINCSIFHPARWDYTMSVGYSALCPESESTWAIVTSIINQLAADTPGPYINIGGDEVPTNVLSHDRYAAFVNRAADIVVAAGKIPMGWAEIAGSGTTLPAGTIAQYWNPAAGSEGGTETATEAVAKGAKVVMSPATHAYLDQVYAPDEPNGFGLSWACPGGCDVESFYGWDPAAYVDGVGEDDVLGVEGTLFSETLQTLEQAEQLMFPRLIALAEVGWSPAADRSPGGAASEGFLGRLAAQGPRLTAAGIDYFPSDQVPWP